jgi:hypothetical protein
MKLSDNQFRELLEPAPLVNKPDPNTPHGRCHACNQPVAEAKDTTCLDCAEAGLPYEWGS